MQISGSIWFNKYEDKKGISGHRGRRQMFPTPLAPAGYFGNAAGACKLLYRFDKRLADTITEVENLMRFSKQSNQGSLSNRRAFPSVSVLTLSASRIKVILRPSKKWAAAVVPRNSSSSPPEYDLGHGRGQHGTSTRPQPSCAGP